MKLKKSRWHPARWQGGCLMGMHIRVLLPLKSSVPCSQWNRRHFKMGTFFFGWKANYVLREALHTHFCYLCSSRSVCCNYWCFICCVACWLENSSGFVFCCKIKLKGPEGSITLTLNKSYNDKESISKFILSFKQKCMQWFFPYSG